MSIHHPAIPVMTDKERRMAMIWPYLHEALLVVR